MSYYNNKTKTLTPSYKTIGDYLVYPITKNLVDVFLASSTGWGTGARIRIYKGNKEIVKTWGVAKATGVSEANKVPATLLQEVKL